MSESGDHQGLKGKKIVLLEGRMSSEMAELVRRRGGEPYSVPAVREHALEAGPAVESFLNELRAGSVHIVIFQTRVGADELFNAAEKLGRLPELIAALGSVTTICRGPKPAAALQSRKIRIDKNIREPYTTQEILEVLDTLGVAGKRVALIHYGERNAGLAEAIRSRSATVSELCLYEWLLPDDLHPLQTLVHDLQSHRFDAVVFTSQVQVRHLFQVAESMHQVKELTAALNAATVASIGPTCTASLESYHVKPQVIPQHPKMGPLVLALAEYLRTAAGQAAN